MVLVIFKLFCVFDLSLDFFSVFDIFFVVCIVYLIFLRMLLYDCFEFGNVWVLVWLNFVEYFW